LCSFVAALSLARCQRTPETGSPQVPSAQSNALGARLAADALSSLSEGSREAVSRSPLPVLLFGDAAMARASQVTAGPAWYAISSRVGERTYSLHVVRDESSGAAPEGHTERVRGAPAMVLFNEGVRSVTWSERGATYALEVECYRPFEDAACAQSEHVKALAESLVIVAPGQTQRVSAPSAQGTSTGGVR
jgi:hypothetical protein